MPYNNDMKKKNLLDGLVRGRARFVLNQTAPIFADKREKRKQTRIERKRRAIQEQTE